MAIGDPVCQSDRIHLPLIEDAGSVHITWDIANLEFLGNELRGYIIADVVDRNV